MIQKQISKSKLIGKVKYSRVLFILMSAVNYEATIWDGDLFEVDYLL